MSTHGYGQKEFKTKTKKYKDNEELRIKANKKEIREVESTRFIGITDSKSTKLSKGEKLVVTTHVISKALKNS